MVPERKTILMTASEAGAESACICGTSPTENRAPSPPGISEFPRAISPNGKFVSAQGPDHRLYLYPLAGGEPSAGPRPDRGEDPTGWSVDSRLLYFFRRRKLAAKVHAWSRDRPAGALERVVPFDLRASSIPPRPS